MKTDSKSEDLKTTYVQYEIFNPITLEQLDLSICEDYPITINIPILLDKEIELLYQSLNESGYNLFDANDSFYNDICSTFKTENNTDIIIRDRRNYYYESNQNLTLCQTGCTFQYYNSTIKKSICKCDVDNNNITTNTKDIEFDTKNLRNNFLTTLKNSNFMVIKCYQLLLDISKLGKNIGFIIMSIFLLFSIIFIIFHYIISQRKIPSFLNSILRQNFSFAQNYNNKKYKSKNFNNEKDKNNKKGKPDQKDNKIMKNINKKTCKNMKNIIKKSSKKSEREKIKKNSTSLKAKKKNNPPSRKSNNKKSNDYHMKFNSDSILKSNFIRNNNQSYSLPFVELKANNTKSLKDNSIKIYNKNNKANYNDQELNTLEYKIAIEVDKRTYFQYYWSLLKKKQLIIFTFCPDNDYNFNFN